MPPERATDDTFEINAAEPRRADVDVQVQIKARALDLRAGLIEHQGIQLCPHAVGFGKRYEGLRRNLYPARRRPPGKCLDRDGCAVWESHHGLILELKALRDSAVRLTQRRREVF